MNGLLRRYFQRRKQLRIFGSLFDEIAEKAAIIGVEKHGREEYLGILAAADLSKTTSFSSVVDIASGNGVSQSAIWPILQANPSCTGICLEVDPRNFAALATIYSRFPRMVLSRAKVTPANVSTLLSSAEVPKSFDLLNLDIDSYDLPVLESVLESGWRPTILSMEINEKFPPSVEFAVAYDPDFSWDGSHFYGCSISAATRVLSQFEYEPIELRGNNLIAIPQQVLPEDWQSKTIEELYFAGYIDLRKSSGHFAWNYDVDYWQDLAPSELIDEVRDFFSNHPPSSYHLALSAAPGNV